MENDTFNVVYDPRFDRFFLEDEALHRERNRSLERTAVSIPWEKWILPPKFVTKQDTSKDPATLQCEDEAKPGDLASVPHAATEDSPARQFVTPSSDGPTQPTTIPALDFSSFQQPLTEVSVESTKTILAAPDVQRKPKKTRVQDYTVHFKRTNQDVAKLMTMGVTNAEPNHEHEVKWNGEVVHVQIPGLRPQSEVSVARDVNQRDALDRELLCGSAEQWSGSTYELKHLMRIRAHADGLRKVNTACRFVAVSSSESSDSEEEHDIPQQHESEDETDLMPVFFRDDRVLFHAKCRWFKGTVRRRIPSSDFYSIRADNGSLFDAVLASKMELLDEPELPYYHFVRGDKVLWIPHNKDNVTKHSRTTLARSTRRLPSSNNTDDELTYKAKIVQVRSLNRFDLLLRTGRVVQKVPCEQLRPRDASKFVSATRSRRR